AADERPLVLVSFSTAPQGQTDPPRRTLTALATLPARELVPLGPALAADAFAPPPNVVMTDFVPHARVFPHVAAIVPQYGHGTVMKALAHGIPLGGINERAPPLCGAAVISHNTVRETDHQRTARRTSPMKQ